jgi:hypothetical protein
MARGRRLAESAIDLMDSQEIATAILSLTALLPRYGGGQNCHVHLAIPNLIDRRHKTWKQNGKRTEKAILPGNDDVIWPVGDSQNSITAGPRGPVLRCFFRAIHTV